MIRWVRSLSLVALVALGAAGCQDGVGDSDFVEEETLRADAALVAADAMFEDLVLMQDPPVLALLGAGPELAGAEVVGSHTFSKQVRFFAEGGTEQDRFDPLLTASIEVVWDLARSAENAFWSASIQRHRDMTVTGLLGMETQRTWNGTGTGVVARSRHPEEGVTRTYDMSSEVQIEDVVRGVPRMDHPYPLSGTITRRIHVVVTGATVAERDVTAVITFDGTQFATVTVGPDSWKIDLSQGRVRDVLKRPRP